MATQEHYPDPNTKEKIHHSGKDGRETPVVDYDNTSLQEATDAHFTKDGQLVIPKNPAEGFTEKPLSEEELKALEDFRKKQAKKDRLAARRRRNIRLVAGSAAASVIMGGGAYLYGVVTGGDNSEREAEPGVSAPANPNPSEAVPTAPEQTTTPDSGITMENLSSYMIEYGGSPEEISGNYSNILTDIINNRFQNKEFGMKTDDLVYLVDPSNVQLTESYARYIDNLVQHLVAKEKEAKEKGLDDGGVAAGVAIELTSGEMTTNGVVVEMNHDYRVNTGFGEYLGSLLDSDDPTRATFERQEVTLPNGEVSSTLRLVDRYDTLNNQSY